MLRGGRRLASDGAIGAGEGSSNGVKPASASGMPRLRRPGPAGRHPAGGLQPPQPGRNLIVNRTDGQPVGESFIQENFDPRDPHPLQEAMGAVDATAFIGVQGQILINRLLQMYEQEDFVTSR